MSYEKAKHPSRPFWKKVGFWVLVAIFFNPVSLFMGGFLAVYHFTNFTNLNRFAAPFFDYPLPPNTLVLADQAFVDYSLASCRFNAQRELATTLSLDELKIYYAEAVFPVPIEYSWHRPDERLSRVRIEAIEISAENLAATRQQFVLGETTQISGFKIAIQAYYGTDNDGPCGEISYR